MRPNFAVILSGVLANMLSWSSAALAGPPPLWGKLAPGPHAVGFRSVWQMDYSRTYHMVFDDKTTYAMGKAPRPILVNIWYPATTPDDPLSMPHGDYLAIPKGDTRVARFAAKLETYERAVVCKEVLGKAPAELTERERRAFDQFWKTPTACFRDAPALDSRFPLVIYHSGFGASFEDNAVLCEFLASHGYVVVGSAFQESSGATFNVGGPENSARDMEFLIAYARRYSFVDWNHIAVVGHSGGAQYALFFRAQDASPADAVVSLDTTQDKHSLADHRGEYFTGPVLKNSRNMTVPLLVAANADAFFELADSLEGCTRHYLTVAALDHDDFISQGIIHHDLECRLDPGKKELRSRLEAARSSYEGICAYVLDFLDGCFKRNVAEKSPLVKKYEQNRLGGPAPHVEIAPPGATGPEPFRDDSNEPPTPRQLRPLLAKRGADATLALLEQYHAKEPHAAIFQGEFGSALVYEFLAKGRTREAIAFHRLYRKFGQDLAGKD